MRRLARTLLNDIVIQFRNRLYAIGVGVAIVVALLVSTVMDSGDAAVSMPTMLLLVVGGSTLMYVGGVILFEKAEGTLGATVVTPLRDAEYLVSKVMSLSLLASVEATVLVTCTLLLASGWDADLPQFGVFLPGVLSMGVIYTLIGIVLVVRYDSVTEFLVPILFVAIVLQMPAIYFSGLWEHPLLLLIPTAPPTLLIQGAWKSLSPGEWIFAGTYTVVAVASLYCWARRAFHRHIILGISS